MNTKRIHAICNDCRHDSPCERIYFGEQIDFPITCPASGKKCNWQQKIPLTELLDLLANDSFEGWTKDETRGYLTALITIKAAIIGNEKSSKKIDNSTELFLRTRTNE